MGEVRISSCDTKSVRGMAPKLLLGLRLPGLSWNAEHCGVQLYLLGISS